MQRTFNQPQTRNKLDIFIFACTQRTNHQCWSSQTKKTIQFVADIIAHELFVFFFFKYLHACGCVCKTQTSIECNKIECLAK